MRRRPSALTAAALTVALGAAACGSGGGSSTEHSSPGFAECDSKPNTCNTTPTKPGGSLVISIEKTIHNWNTADTDGNSYETGQVLTGITPTPFYIAPDTSVQWNKDLLTAEPNVASTSPLTVVYHLRPEAKWDDGTPISAKDFAYFWHSNNGKDCPECNSAGNTGYDAISSVVGSDSDRTVTITYDKPFPDWKSLFSGLYPAHLAAKAGDLATPAGLKAAFDAFKTDPPAWTGGPYKITGYDKDVSVTLSPNPNWYGSTKPALEKIIFKIIEDQPQQLPALRNKEIQALISQPSADMVAQVKGMAGVNFNLSKGLSWEHVDLNTTGRWLRDIPLRQAIFTAIDRKSIIDKTIGTFFPGAAPLGSHNFVPSSPGYKDLVTPTGQGSGNADAARKILTDAGYTITDGKLFTRAKEQVPPLRFRFSVGNQLRQQSAELIQAELKPLGIEVKIEPTGTLNATLSTGDFDLIIYAWVTSPFLSGAVDLWGTKGGANYGHYSNPRVDALLAEAARTLDTAKANDLWNQADEIMTREAYNLPMFQKPVFLAVYSDYGNIRNNATSAGPAYNIGEWGLKA